MVNVLEQAAVVVLPTTYREGIPKILIEAAACSRPIVTTDTPGCREIVRQNVNGILIPPGDAPALADAISSLVEAPELRRRYGTAGRSIVEAEFSESMVVEQTLDVYQQLLGASWAQA